jgi:hypothetical protein
MKSEDEIKYEIQRRIKRISNERLTHEEMIICCDWINCLGWVLQEDNQ